MSLPYFQIDIDNERLKTYRKRNPAVWKEFLEKLDLSWIYHDHGLEGVAVQYHEIVDALSGRTDVDNNTLQLYKEINNYHQAIKFIRKSLEEKKSQKITRSLIQQCYQILVRDLRGYDENSGLRKEDGRYGAYYHKSCPHTEVERNLRKALQRLNNSREEEFHPIVVANRFHYDFMKIMPYGQMSGKLARLLANMILMKYNYPPSIIHMVERARYYEALAQENERQLLTITLEALTNIVEKALQYFNQVFEERKARRTARRVAK